MTLIPPMLGNHGAGLGAGLTLTYIGENSSGEGTRNTSDPLSFGNFTAAEAGLMIVVAWSVSGSTGDEVASCTIGGSAATANVRTLDTSSSRSAAAVFSLEVSSGAQEVIVNYTTAPRACGVAVYLLTGYSSTTPNDTDAAIGTTSATSISATLNIPAGGVAVFIGATQNDGSGYTFSSATEDAEWLNHDSGNIYGGAAGNKTTETLLTGHTETLSFASNDERCIAAASWG